ncbi:MAG: glycine cleavage system protein GcvH [Bdellovibrionales bacterium]|nr:glycine cleavage system protein GcvH [Bdellovibrionales bacterium]
MEETPKRLIVPGDNYYYTKTHEWISLDDRNTVTIGITYYAQDRLGEIVSWRLPKKGQNFEKNHIFGLVESNKHVSDLYLPVSGEIVEINESLSPGIISDDPMGKGWLIRVEMSREGDLADLMSPAAYKKLIEEEIKSLE